MYLLLQHTILYNNELLLNFIIHLLIFIECIGQFQDLRIISVQSWARQQILTLVVQFYRVKGEP